MFKKLPMYQNIGKSAYKKNLDNITLACNHLNNPQENFKSIHIGGTNGKGSCSHMMSSIFQESGYKVGLYTSPHLKDFRERIRINGKMILKDSVLKFMNNNLEFFESNNLSFFEMTVALAFNYFSDQSVDIAIIEVGMGGRLDSTNIISPELSVITNIGLDHTKFLGNSLNKIAIEKGGIIKKNTTVIIGETQNETNCVFKKIAKKNNADIFFADQFNYPNYDCDLKGNYQKKNIKTILKSVEILSNKGFMINKLNIKNGLKNVVKNTGLKGRWQVLQREPLIICDTAHNEPALNEVISQLMNLDYYNLHIIIGFTDDKNIDKIAKIFPVDSIYYFVKPNIMRAIDNGVVMRVFNKNKRVGKKIKSVKLALEMACRNANKNDVIFIGGSTFVVSEII